MDKRQILIDRLNSLPADKREELIARISSSAFEDNGINQVPTETNVSASYSQRNIWIAENVSGNSSKYNMASAYRLTGKINIPAFERAIQDIVCRHDSLRTYFFEEDGEILQRVDNQYQFSLNWDVQDASFNSDREWKEGCEEGVAKIVKEHSSYVFDLGIAPLFKVSLIKLKDDVHLFLLNFHHIVFDGWSKGIFLRELNSIYQYRCQHGIDGDIDSSALSLPDLPVQYRDFSHWQQAQESLPKQISYWKHKLEGAPALLDFPTDKPRGAKLGNQGDIERIIIDESTTKKANDTAKKHNVTTYTTVLTAFSILLAKYAGQQEVVIGAPVDNRSQSEVQNLIGYFLNTIAFRMKVDWSRSFSCLLDEARTTCREAYSNQDAPWDDVLQAVNIPRSNSHTPLFQVMLVFQNSKSHEFELFGLHTEKVGSGTNTTKYDLYLTFVEKEGRLEGWLTYNSELFLRSTIKRLVANFKDLLKLLVDMPDFPLSKLNLAMGEERSVLQQIDREDRHYEGATRVHDAIKGQANTSPDNIALTLGSKKVSYQELDKISDIIAHNLSVHGIVTGSIVGLQFPRSIEMIASMLAVFKLGATYVPLDPYMPKQRIEKIIGMSDCTLVLCLEANAELVLAAEKMVIDAEVLLSRDAPCNPLPALTKPSTLAYIMYTSGSTGEPKGVMGNHDGIMNRLNFMATEYPYDDQDVLCHKTTCNFVDSVAEIWAPLVAGKTLNIYPQDSQFDLFDFIQFLADQKVSRLVLVPSLLRSIINFYPDLQEILPSLKILVVSGEVITKELAELFHSAKPDSLLINIYGSTEVSADATYYEVDWDSSHNTIPIGKPIPNNYVRIFDEAGNICPVGVKGEIYIGGTCLSSGYYKQDEQTRRAFVSNIESSGSIKETLFKTGDIGRLLDDGNIEYIGRIDNQVKINGVRLELAEIEAALLENICVFDAVCRVDDNNGETLVDAYIVFHDDMSADITSISDQLREKLPSYMLPSSITVLSQIPRSYNGKIDRKSLPAANRDVSSDKEYEQPTTASGLLLAEIWREALNVNQVGVNDNFFDLGGHSLMATKVVAEVRKQLEVEINVRDVFESLTLKNLIKIIDRNITLDKVNTNDLSDKESEIFEF